MLQAFHISPELPPIILVRSSRPSFWDSCVSIVNNLETSYRIAFGERIRIFDYHSGLIEETLLKELQALYNAKIDEIIIIDHYPPLTRLFRAIDSIWIDHYPKIIIHTFGGFTFRFDEYSTIEEIFKKLPLKIIAPSERAMSFIENHFEKTDSLFFKMPFPVSTSSFNFEEGLYSTCRERFNLNDADKVITYAGRIAEGKNLEVLIDCFVEVYKTNKDAKLIIAGESDDSLTPGFKRKSNDNVGIEFKKYLSKLSPEIKNRIQCPGKLSKPDLKLLLHATDVFLSLSTYPLEDFGMGPLEALACGCPVILTDWGGYSDFRSIGGDTDCSLIKVSITETGHQIDTKQANIALGTFLKERENPLKRKTRSDKVIQRYSPESIANEIRIIHERPYFRMNGFSAYARGYVWINKGEKFAQVKDTFYHSLYRSYFE